MLTLASYLHNTRYQRRSCVQRCLASFEDQQGPTTVGYMWGICPLISAQRTLKTCFTSMDQFVILIWKTDEEDRRLPLCSSRTRGELRFSETDLSFAFTSVWVKRKYVYNWLLYPAKVCNLNFTYFGSYVQPAVNHLHARFSFDCSRGEGSQPRGHCNSEAVLLIVSVGYFSLVLKFTDSTD